MLMLGRGRVVGDRSSGPGGVGELVSDGEGGAGIGVGE